MKLALKLRARFSPRAPRQATVLDTYMILQDDRIAPISVRNISANGFMAATDEDVEIGSSFGVEIPTLGIVRAVVRWAESGKMGVQFRTPLNREQLQRVIDSRDSGLLHSAWR